VIKCGADLHCQTNLVPYIDMPSMICSTGTIVSLVTYSMLLSA